MKRLLYILLCLPIWLACTDENIPSSNHPVEEGKEVKLRMSVVLEEMNIASSRAFGEDITDFPSLWIVAFDKDGYLVEWAEATDLKRTTITNADGNTTNSSLHETEFSVILRATSDHRTLHFIANYADELNLEFGHESNLIGSLTVSGDKDVYWHRKELSGGINTDDTYIANNFRRIPLLRNFAKITVGVDSEVTNFTLTGFYVLNVPTSGTVAPYSNGKFVDYMSTTIAETAKTYKELNDEGYIGTMPDDVEYKQSTAPDEWVATDGSFYMYENTYRDDKEKTTSILIKGKFGTSTTETFYRADLTIPDVATGLSEYYHILRNFHYHLNITSVIAAGKTSADLAISAPANNNLSGAVEVKNLSNISDGTAKLEVSYTDMVLVSTDKVTLKYRFLTDVSNENSVANNRIKIYTKAEEDKPVIASYSPETTTNIAVDSDGWSTITITPVGTLPEATRVQTLTLYDETTKLRREVQYTLRSKLDMVVKCVPKKVESTAGTAVEVDICIPNNLNENLFPLDFAIEAQTSAASTTLKQYISPKSTEVMSVTTGGSIVDGHLGEKSYQYIKELTYEAYKELAVVDGRRVFPVDFVTNTAASASMVYVDNKYFNKGSDFFVNTLPALVDTEYYGVGKDVFYVLEASTAGDYTITATYATPATQTVQLAANDVYETILKTTTWSSNTSVTVGSTTKEGTTTRNKLAMKAASTSGTDLTASTELYVYTSENDAKALAENSLGMVTNGTLTSSFNGVITADSLQATTPIYFAYETAEYYYVASATAEALASGTATLTFTSYEKPLEMSVVYGEDANKYGTSKAFKLTFTTNKSGRYNFTTTNFTINGLSDSFNIEKAGTYTVDCTSNSWNGQYSITIDYQDDALGGTDPNTWTGPTRNVYSLNSSNTITIRNIDNVDDNATITIYKTTNTYNSYRAFSNEIGTITKAELANGEFDMHIDGLSSNEINSTSFYFVYSSNETNRYASCTIQQLLDGVTLNFANYNPVWW